MYISYQKFIVMVIIYSLHNTLANENNNCDCDILQIESGVPWIPGYKPHGLIGNQNLPNKMVLSMENHIIFQHNRVLSLGRDNIGLMTYMMTI